MFKMLTKSKLLEPIYYNPINNHPIFLMFDSVHLYKCIRNNWLNTKHRHTFEIPNFDNLDNISRASFGDLESIYNIECNNLIKPAPNLSYKCLS